MKYFIALTFLVFHFASIAQVGIGTENPNALLDIRSSNQSNPSATDGIIIPKADNLTLEGPTLIHDGMLIYITGEGTTPKGFYSWDNGAGKWQRQSPSGLESLDEGNGIGWRLIGRDTSLYTGLGLYALDFSLGHLNSGASGPLSTTFGFGTHASHTLSFASGSESEASGYASTALNNFTKANSFGSFAAGSFNIGGGSEDEWISTDPIFEIGNGNLPSARSNALTVLKNGSIMAPSLDTSEITENRSLITKEYADAYYADTVFSGDYNDLSNLPTIIDPSGLEALDEGNGIGWRLVGNGPALYTSLGDHAVDLSFSNASNGAGGDHAMAVNFNTIAFGLGSFAAGDGSFANGDYSFASGAKSSAFGDRSAAFNSFTSANAFASFAVGSFNTGGGNGSSWIATDPIFEVGNGTAFNNRSNALTVLKNGKILAPSLSQSEITEDKSLITKEYADANYYDSPYGLEEIDEGNGVGWRLIGREPLFYADIGTDAVDLSYSNEVYTPPPPPATSLGVGNGASGAYSLAAGINTTAQGLYSFATGLNSTARCTGCTAIGISNIGGGSPTSTLPSDPLFEVGNGDFMTQSNAFTVLRNGYVGIGTNVPAYPLHITSSVSGLNSSPAHYLHHTEGVGSNGSGWSYGLGVSLGVFSSLGFATGSDERIKDIVGISNGQEDLETLSKIQITDYTFKDIKKHGKQITKKVIAQQVRNVYPKAVNMSSNYIPNIYQEANVKSTSNTRAILYFGSPVDLRIGNEVKLFDESNNEYPVTIEQVSGLQAEISTTISLENIDQVFVYGKKVDDFHNVDYDAISMLNVSATQELYKRIKLLEQANKDLVEDFNQRLTQLEAQISPKFSDN